MEKMVASLAIRTALCNMTTLPRSDILFVDEGFGALDPVQMEQVGRLLTSLAKHFRAVVVISHFDAIKDVAETTIEVTRNEHDSKVVYVL
jgi:exonuclease SbcC